MAESRTHGEIMGQSTLEEVDARVSKETFVELLRMVADGLESGHEFEVELKGQHIFVPQGGEMEVEIDQGERELEFRYRWKY